MGGRYLNLALVPAILVGVFLLGAGSYSSSATRVRAPDAGRAAVACAAADRVF